MELNFNTVDQLCASVDMTVTSPTIDFSDITFVHPYSILYIGMFLRHHNSLGKSLKFIIPRDTSVKKYLTTQKFWSRFNFNPASFESSDLVPISNNTSLNDIIDIENRDGIADEIAIDIRNILYRNAITKQASKLASVMSELVDNFACHATTTLAATTMQIYPNLKQIEIAIADCGIGVRATLSKNSEFTHLKSQPHYKSAIEAFKPLVSCRPGCGMGLTEVQDELVKMNADLIFTTGDGFVIINGKGEKQYGNMAYDLPGVKIQITCPIGG